MRYFLAASMALVFCVLAHADVEYMGTDTDTLGNWVDVYGANGVILFAPKDLADMKDITSFDDGGNLRWDWANPTGDERGLFYPDGSDKRAGSCMYNNPVGLLTLETSLKEYQVAVSMIDWDSSVRLQDIVGFQGDDPPKNPDAEVANPEFHQGIYYLWQVTGDEPFKLQITHKGGANWVISGLFVDALNLAVSPGAKLSTTWGDLKSVAR